MEVKELPLEFGINKSFKINPIDPDKYLKEVLNKNISFFDGFKFVSPQTDQMLKEIGGQKGSNDCLEYAQKYAHWILNNNAGYQVIGSSSEKAILQVAAFELYKKRPVITRVNGGSEVKKNGLPMHSRHFVTIIRNKGKC